MDVYVATILIIAAWASSDSVAFGSDLQSSCYEFDVSWVNGALEDFKFPVNDASQCQEFCEDSTNCTSWTWTTEENHQIKSTCFLFSKTGNQTHWPNTVSGPRSCSCSKNEACSATKENVIRVEVINDEETCKDFCYNTTGCSFYTWYDSSDFLPPICILLSECTETFSSCTSCFSGPPTCKTEPQEELDGEWQQTHYPLLEERVCFSSWETSNGGIYLFGGAQSPYTSEVVDADGNTESGFDLTDDTRYTCSIEDNDEDRVILTGELDKRNSKNVSVFDKNGFVEQLPDLLTGRFFHACGFFINNDKNKVLLVAGGYGYSRTLGRITLDSTESLLIGDSSWQTEGSLPNAVHGIKGVSISNKIFLTGGYYRSLGYSDSVLEFNQETRDWKLVGHLSKPRGFHAASVVPLKEASKYCQASNQMETRTDGKEEEEEVEEPRTILTSWFF